MKILHLTLKKKWFDMIASGKKKEEYREIKWFWIRRLTNIGTFPPIARIEVEHHLKNRDNPLGVLKEAKADFNNYDVVVFKNGYQKNAPTIMFKCLGISIGSGKYKWGGGGRTFIISLGKQVGSNYMPNRLTAVQECDARKAD